MRYAAILLGIYGMVLGAASQQESRKIPLYYISTPSHDVLKNEWFLPSVLKFNEFDLHEFSSEQTCASGQFLTAGWKGTTLAKVDMILQAIEENWGDVFVYSDVDICFYKPMEAVLLRLVENNDFVIQKDAPSGGLCTGFFICRANEKTQRLWQETKKIMLTTSKSDQASFNTAVSQYGRTIGAKWARLPVSFYGGGTLTGRRWSPGQKLPVPKDIYIHHANWTVGVPNKIAQLILVKNLVENKNIYYGFKN